MWRFPIRSWTVWPLVLQSLLVVWGAPAGAQESDLSRTPNSLGAGIQKSLEQQIGNGRGDLFTPGSSRFIIARDPFRAIARGRQLFQRKFSLSEGLGPRTDDGVGNIDSPDDASRVAGVNDSCAGCHSNPGGSAGFGGRVFTRPDGRDAPHLFGLGLQEMLADEITHDLRAIRDGALQQAGLSGRALRVPLRSKEIDYGWLTANPDGSVNPSEIKGVDQDLRVKPFFAEGSAYSIRQFVVGALNAEMGLEAPDPDLLAASRGERVTTPAGMVLDGSLDPVKPPPVTSPSEDGDRDGVRNEIDPALVDYLEFYLLNYFRPARYEPDPASTAAGLEVFKAIGCESCHNENKQLADNRELADVTTVYDPVRGVFNSLFATARRLVEKTPDNPALPPLQKPAGHRFLVRGIFADFKRHDLGPNFAERNFDGTLRHEFMTEPLWGVASSAPYGHDGRSVNLREVILRHGGEAEAARDAFAALPDSGQLQLLDFLGSLVLFPPPATASNLDPPNPADPNFPQSGHGSLSLFPLFNDPSDRE
jgi:hypothetical protein